MKTRALIRVLLISLAVVGVAVLVVRALNPGTSVSPGNDTASTPESAAGTMSHNAASKTETTAAAQPAKLSSAATIAVPSDPAEREEYIRRRSAELDDLSAKDDPVS